MMDDVLLEAKSLTLTVGQKKLLQEANFVFFQSGNVVIEGQNGSGKSSLLKEIYFRSHRSEVWKWNGVPQKISYLSHELGLYTSLSLWENLEFFLGEKIARSEKSEELLKKFKLEKRIWDPISTYSRGMKQKSALMRILLSEARILLLDEPYTGLDVESSEILTNELNRISKQKLILLVLHGMVNGLTIRDRIQLGKG
ncbi:MAG: ATP-binding cassette domain-containing protein [Leptospira sp.]|nr:ATP-binding cassette domain-containing protein [Leptospira sp.]